MAARSSDEPPGRGTPRGGPPTSGSLDETRLAPSASTPRPAPPSEGLPAHLDETHAPRGEASATSAARANPLDETCLAPATPRPARRGETLPATSSAGQLGETLPATSSAGQRGETLPSTPRPPSLDETRLAPSTSPRRRVDAPTPDLEATRLRGAAGGDDDPPPARIGRFLVLRQLGRGGMGVVYAAYDDHLDRRVAIKLLRDQGDGADDRLLREAQALARLSHPNVVGVYEVDRALESIYIAMEFVVGVTLREWLAARPRSRAEIVDVFLQAGRGLAAAHAVGLIHRDFKPKYAKPRPERP